jgi:acetylornithine deacetylase
VIGHKGGRAYKVQVRGTEAHSSLAPLAVNAVEYAAELIVLLKVAEEMRVGVHDDQYDVPHSTLQTGMIRGGTAINIVPRDCQFIFEFRHLVDTDPEGIKTKIETFIRSKITAGLPDARLYAFDGKGHLPIFTATDEFCEVLRCFVHTGTAIPGGRP